MSEALSSGVAHFSVDGAWLCSTIRDCVLSDRWETAVRILDEIDGLTRAQAQAILNGEYTITADLSGLEPLSHEETQAYTKALSYVYAGRIKLTPYNGWWRPVAAVTDLGPRDLDELEKEAKGLIPRAAEVYDSTLQSMATNRFTRRIGYYTHDGEKAVLIKDPVFSNSPTSTGVIFESCNSAPTWLVPLEDASAAVAEWVAEGREILKRGHYYLPRDLTRERVWQRPVVEPEVEVLPQPTEDQRVRARKVYLRMLRDRIHVQAGGDDAKWRLLQTRTGSVYAVLRKPFDLYTLENARKFGGGDQEALDKLFSARAENGLDWEPISPYDFKMGGDSRTHSDWLLGALQDLDRGDRSNGSLPIWSDAFVDDPTRWYFLHESEEGKALQSAIYYLQTEVEEFYLRNGPDPLDVKVEDFGSMRPLVIRRGEKSTWEGSVRHPQPDEEVPAGSIIVVPHLGPEYYIPAASAGSTGCVIAGAGGQTAHLAQVALDHVGGFPALVVVSQAVTLHPAGSMVHVDLNGPTVARRAP